MPDWKAAANLVRKIAENYKLPYYTLSPTYSVCKNHGYIAGEHKVCPECGEKTEVYSRITGYYRPVQNWNDGKAQEYKDRKVYDISHSHLTHNGPVTDCPCDNAEPTETAVNAGAEKTALLFTTATCPNCKIACATLDKAGYKYEKLLANESVELVNAYGVKQAPTLVVFTKNGFEKYAGVSDIKKFLLK